MVLLAVLLEQPIERLLLAHGELARLDARVVHTQERVDVVHRLRAHVRELLDLRGCILDLDYGDKSRVSDVCREWERKREEKKRNAPPRL